LSRLTRDQLEIKARVLAECSTEEGKGITQVCYLCSLNNTQAKEILSSLNKKGLIIIFHAENSTGAVNRLRYRTTEKGREALAHFNASGLSELV
jgi:predicted transcriptional regulator